MEPDAIWASVGGVGGLVASLVGLIIALRSGVLASGKELTRLQQAHVDELKRLEGVYTGTIQHERSNAGEWRQNSGKLQEALDVALEANRTWARQAEIAAVTQDLTNKVLETVNRRAASS